MCHSDVQGRKPTTVHPCNETRSGIGDILARSTENADHMSAATDLRAAVNALNWVARRPMR